MTITTSTSTPTGTYTITVTGSGGGVSKSTSYTLTVVYTVNFYIYDDAGSSVSGATLVFNSQSYSHGGSTSVAAGSYSLSTGTIPSGYRFKQWETSGGVSVASSTSTSTTATVSSSGSITMRLQRTATVTFSATGLGSDASGNVLTVDGATYPYSSLPVSFTWDVGSSHGFAWSDPIAAGGAGTDKRYVWVSTTGLSTAKYGSFTVPAGGGSVSATYKTQYYLRMSLSPSGAGSIWPGVGWYDAGMQLQIGATANSGYRFSRWSGSGSGSYSGTNNPASITMNGPITETAYFKVGVTFDAVKTSGARFNSNPSMVLYLGSPISTWYSYGQLPVTVYLEPGASLYFSWNSPVFSREGYPSRKYDVSDARYDWVSTTGYSTSQSATIAVPSSPASITTRYDRYVLVTVDIAAPYSAAGSVSPSGWSYYLEGTSFTATANYGYQFHHWVVDDSAWSYSNPYTVDRPRVLLAVFYIKVTVYPYCSDYESVTTSVSVDTTGETRTGTTLVFYVPYGYNTLTAAYRDSSYGGSFWQWRDSLTGPAWSTSTSYTVFVYQPVTYYAFYRTPIRASDFVKYSVWFSYPNMGASGAVKSMSGSYISGVTVDVMFIYNVPTVIVPGGVKAVTARVTSDSGGYFSATNTDWIATGLIKVRLDIVSVPDGYEIAEQTTYWYP
jgi:hypothetical protein